VVRRSGSHDNQIDLAWIRIGHVQRAPGSLNCEGRRRLAVRDDVAAGDAGALTDPLVGSVHHAGQIIVCENALRHGHAPPDDLPAHPVVRRAVPRSVRLL